jgi:hypothetical protein
VSDALWPRGEAVIQGPYRYMLTRTWNHGLPPMTDAAAQIAREQE